MAPLDKDTWTRRFAAQLAILDRDTEPHGALAIAEDCWEWDGMGSPEAAAQAFAEAAARRGDQPLR